MQQLAGVAAQTATHACTILLRSIAFQVRLFGAGPYF